MHTRTSRVAEKSPARLRPVLSGSLLPARDACARVPNHIGPPENNLSKIQVCQVRHKSVREAKSGRLPQPAGARAEGPAAQQAGCSLSCRARDRLRHPLGSLGRGLLEQRGAEKVGSLPEGLSHRKGL